jgi:predicted dinucleotide-binding enzyme
VTTVGFIGSGRIGGMEARLAIAAGYDVVLSNSRGPQALKDLVKELAPHARAATPAGAAAAGDLVVVVSIPPRAYPGSTREAAGRRSWTRSSTCRNATGGYQGLVARSPAARCSSGT